MGAAVGVHLGVTGGTVGQWGAMVVAKVLVVAACWVLEEEDSWVAWVVVVRSELEEAHSVEAVEVPVVPQEEDQDGQVVSVVVGVHEGVGVVFPGAAVGVEGCLVLVAVGHWVAAVVGHLVVLGVGLAMLELVCLVAVRVRQVEMVTKGVGLRGVGMSGA